MVKLIDSDDGEEYEETEEDIARYERYYARLAEKQQELGLPEYKYGVGSDGHKYRYNVIDKYPNGALRTSGFDAVHQDDCLCSDPERFY